MNCRSTLTLMMMATMATYLLPATAFAQQKDEDAKKGTVRLTKAPKLKKTVEAKYTKKAIDARAEGPVKLRLTIDANGKVTKVEILSGPGYGLNESAAEAAKQFVFEPAEINNVPSPVTLGFTVNFTLPILPSKFEGKVIDAKTQKGLKSVKVSILYTGPEKLKEPPAADTKTDDDGKFSFSNVPPGKYQVKLAVDQYRDFTTDITLVPGKTSEATYKVESQPINLTGQIREAGTRKILPAVKVTIEDKKGKVVRQGYTDEKGKFGFRGLAPGKYNVRVKAQGYLAAAFEETIKAKEITNINMYIESAYYDQYTVKTTAKRAKKEVSRQTISLQEARRVPGTGGDVVRVVQNLPGVARAPFGSGQLVVRGSNPQDSAVFLMGDELPLVYHFLAGPAVVNSEMIQSINFQPGNFSAYYGRAIAGIIDLGTRSPRTDSIHGFAEVDIIDANAVVEAPISDNFSFALAGRRSYIDQILPLVIPDDAGFFVSPYYYDYQSWLTYRSKDSKVELFIYGSQDELKLNFDEAVGNENVQITSINQKTAFHRGQLRWEWKPKGPIQNTLMASFGLIQAGLDAGQIGFNQDIWTLGVRNDLRMKISDKLTFRTGVDFQLLQSNFKAQLPAFGAQDPGNTDGPNNGGNGPPADGLDLDLTFSVLYPAVYAELEYQPVEGLTLIPGLRVDHYGTNTDTTFAPRLAGRWQINKKWAVKGGAGLFTQPPEPNEALEFAQGNPDIESPKAAHYAFGGEFRPLEYLEFDTTLFYRDMFDLVVPTTEFAVDPETNEVTNTFYNNDGLGRAYGAEFLIRHYPNNRFFGWVAYTLSRSERQDPLTKKWEVYQFDQTHILTLVAGYNLPWNIDVSARFQYVTGNPYTPIVGSTFNVEEDEFLPINGARNSARNPAFNQLDVRVDKKWVFDKWMLGMFLDIQNVYNATNAEGVQYNYDYSETAPVSGIPFLPSLGVNAKF